MIAALLSGQVAAGLLLRGGWDLWAQSAALIALLPAWGFWAARGAASGRLRLPAPAPLAWAAALAALSWLSAARGPVPAYSLPAWAVSAAGLWLIPAATLASARERERADDVLRAAAWMLVLLAAFQRVQGGARPPAAFVNQNVFAGAILLLLPLAARRRDWPLAAGLLLSLWWARSVGAWLGLAAALLLRRRAPGAAALWAGAGVGAVALAAAAAKLHAPEILHRWAWWGAAWDMAAGAPWLGLGPGAYAYALPAHVPARPELSTLFAHEHFLETAAERGWPYLLLWLGGLAAVLRRADADRRAGPVAALVHGLADYPLSVPGVFWLFCLSVGWALPPSEESVLVRGGPRRAAAALAALVLAAAGAAWAANNWHADRLRALALQSLREGALSAAPRAGRLLAESEALRPHPEAARLRAELALSGARGGRTDRRLEQAAGDLERAVALDPYRASSWTLLEDVYRRLGRPDAALRVRERGARTCPALRGGA